MSTSPLDLHPQTVIAASALVWVNGLEVEVRDIDDIYLCDSILRTISEALEAQDLRLIRVSRDASDHPHCPSIQEEERLP